MLDAQYLLRECYFTLLAGLTWNGKPIPVFDEYANVNESAPYVVIADMNERDFSDKSFYGQVLTVTVDVVTEYGKTEPKTRYECDMIANEVLKRLLPGNPQGSGKLYQLDGFQCIRAKKVNGQSLSEISDTTKVFRKVIQIDHTIKQLSYA